VNWTWDPVKAKKYLRKHRVSFELARRALEDPFCLSVPDPYPDEERWQTLGSPSAEANLVLFVVHTWPEEANAVGSIISARKALHQERRSYEER